MKKSGTVVVCMNKLDIDSAVSAGRISVLIISLAICLLGLYGMRYFVTKVIFDPINRLTSIANKLSSGDVDINIELKTDNEIGQLENLLSQLLIQPKDQSLIAELISNGDLNKTAVVKSEKDVLSKSMNKVIETLRNLIGEVGALTKSAAEGRMSERGNVSKYNGGYREIVNGINDTLDAMIAPINEGASALEKIAQGDLTIRITSDYKGDHQLIKNSINTVAESLASTIAEVTEAA